MTQTHSRRTFVTGLTATTVAALAGSLAPSFAEAAPEVTTIRLSKNFRAICEAPKNVATNLLRAEGFTNVIFVEPDIEADQFQMLVEGELDFTTDFAPPNLQALEAGKPIKVLAGLHSGCLELIATEDIRGIPDLKGKRVGVFSLNNAPHILVSLMAAYVGLDPDRDIEWVESPDAGPMQLFNEGKIEAFLGAPPEPQEQRARNFGHTILNTSVDRPWSQHFCCMIASSSRFVETCPVATKRVLRAILKAADMCASDPEQAARLSVEGQFTDGYDYAVEGLKDARFDRWREFDPEDTLRFYALRMHEVGFLKPNPNSIVATGSNWSFLDELKRELKT